MNNDSIGIFDSGVGGLTVFNKIQKLLPKENYIYFGDTKNLPYGSKTKNELIFLTRKIFDFFATKNTKAVIMACNTTSATAYDSIKNDYDFEIYPIIQTSAKYIAKENFNRIAIAATQATINSHAYASQINSYNSQIGIFEYACPDWVSIVENRTSDTKESFEIIKNDIEKILDNNIDKIILGCTHYPYLKETIGKFCDADMLIDPAEYFVKHIFEDLKEKNMLNENETAFQQFLVSSEPERFKKAAKLFCDLKCPPSLIDIDSLPKTHINML